MYGRHPSWIFDWVSLHNCYFFNNCLLQNDSKIFSIQKRPLQVSSNAKHTLGREKKKHSFLITLGFKFECDNYVSLKNTSSDWLSYHDIEFILSGSLCCDCFIVVPSPGILQASSTCLIFSWPVNHKITIDDVQPSLVRHRCKGLKLYIYIFLQKSY